MSEVIVYSGSALSLIDDKSRLAIPANLRGKVDHSSGGRIVCIAKHESDPCLIGFGLSRQQEMLREVDRAKEIALTRGEAFDRSREGRLAFTLLNEVSFDASGRFVMPPLLKSVGGLKSHAYIHGCGHFFSIWDPEVLFDQGDDFEDEKMAARFFLDELKKK